MEQAAASSPVCELFDLTDHYGMPATANGNHLYAVKISDNPSVREDEPAFLMVSAHHGREIATPVLALWAMQELIDQYPSDARTKALVDSHEIWIAPMWNPDGYDHVLNVRCLWRRNLQEYPGMDCSDTSSTLCGVDLNRNYEVGWSSSCSGTDDISDQYYKGPAPFSEVETMTMRAWSEDQHFAKVLDYHSYGNEVLWGYHEDTLGNSCADHPWEAFLESEAAALSAASQYMGAATRPPSADGEHYQWQLARMGSHAMLSEALNQFQPNYDVAEWKADRVYPGTLWFLERPIPVSGHVIDSCSGNPVIADIRYPGVAFEYGEVNQSFAPFGRYHAFLPPGVHQLEFSAQDYETRVVTVTVVAGAGTTQEVELEFTGDHVHCLPEE